MPRSDIHKTYVEFIIAPLFVYLPFWDSTPQLWQYTLYFPCSTTRVPHPWQKTILFTTKIAQKRQPIQQPGRNSREQSLPSMRAVASTQYPLRQMHAQQFELFTEEVDFSTEELSIFTELVRQVSQQLVIVSAEELNLYGTGTLF